MAQLPPARRRPGDRPHRPQAPRGPRPRPLRRGQAATAAIRLGVLDELRLLVNPVLLGGGTPLYDGTYPKQDLRLTNTRRFASGALLNTYDLHGRHSATTI
ncbi:dihydrofolate reductase family protein [Spirillospora sp. NPDC048819]|uniref:dihydrofolate reductase family protein n=1 Tax=Spirillospora sp. NPDC048819 TaxID=3155268 RepID=UPI0033F42432